MVKIMPLLVILNKDDELYEIIQINITPNISYEFLIPKKRQFLTYLWIMLK